MPDAEKRARADFVIDTGGPLETTRDKRFAASSLVWRAPARFISGAMREIVFDTETTGLSPLPAIAWSRSAASSCSTGSRPAAPSTLISIPGRPMPSGAEAVHGLSDAFLADKPRFHERCEELLEFLGDCPLVAHNASFDFGFLNHELDACGRPLVCLTRMVDTLAIARHAPSRRQAQPRCALHPLRRRSQPRVKHGALIDAQLLAQCYVELTGGRQIGLSLAVGAAEAVGGGCRPVTRRSS